MARTGKLSGETYILASGTIATTPAEGLMPFRPNYRRDRLERDRAARARADEKQQKRNEKSEKRKAERTEGEGPANEEPTEHTDASGRATWDQVVMSRPRDA
jgi:hypothetical protein